jgi:hypothetical protein
MVEKRRNFRKNPITEQELLETRWYAVDNDLIGGYAVATVDKPESEHNVYEADYTVGTFMTKRCAEHIADLHNQWWTNRVWSSYQPNILVTYMYDTLLDAEWDSLDNDEVPD